MAPDGPSDPDRGSAVPAEDWLLIEHRAQTNPIISAYLHAYNHGAAGTWEHVLVEMVAHLADEQQRLIKLATEALASQAPGYPIVKDPEVSSS